MVSAQLKIRNKLGMHARAAAIFVRESTKFEGEVWVAKGASRVNGKSIMGILTLAAGKGDVVTIEVDGPDEGDVLRELTEIIESGFGEKD